MRYCIFSNPNTKIKYDVLCKITRTKQLDDREFITYKPVIKSRHIDWGQDFTDRDYIKIVSPETHPELFL